MTTKRPTPTETYQAAADAARAIIADDDPTGSSYRFGHSLIGLFEQLSDDTLRLGELSPRMRQLGIDTAAAFVAMHRDDATVAEAIEQAVDKGDPYAMALQVMLRNEQLSPATSAPRELAAAFVDLLQHLAVWPELELDPALDTMLRRLAGAVVALDQAGPDEVEIEPLLAGDFPIGRFSDGALAIGRVSGVPNSGAGKSNVLAAFDEVRVDEFRAGREYAIAAGVDVPAGSMRYRLRSVGTEPVRVDVYDQAGERIAIVTEEPSKHGEHAEWHVGMIAASAAKSACSVSFARVVEHLDRFLGEQIEQRQ